MDLQTIEAVLAEHEFQLVRERKHRVYQNPSGKTWTVPNTPSDGRALQNNFADLRRFLEHGFVRGSFGGSVTAEESARAAEKLRPGPVHKVKEVRERSRGISAERFRREFVIPPEPRVPAPVPAQAESVYSVGAKVRKRFCPLIAASLELLFKYIDADAEDFINAQGPAVVADDEYRRYIKRKSEEIKKFTSRAAYRSVDVIAEAAQAKFRGESREEVLRKADKKLERVWRGAFYSPKRAFVEDLFERMWEGV